MKIIRLSQGHVRRLMLDSIAVARRHGMPLKALPFTVADVDGIHADYGGVRDGVWFRLHDGRVVDFAGRDCDPNPRLYDTLS